MRRAASPLGAGRTTTGSTPHLALTFPAYLYVRISRNSERNIISNRHESYTKQRIGTRSNRHKCRHYFETCHRPGLLQTCQRASRLSSCKPAARLSGRLTGSTGLKTKQTNDTRSNRQKITQISARSRRLLRAWAQYQSGGTRRHAGTAQPSAPAPSTPPWRA